MKMKNILQKLPIYEVENIIIIVKLLKAIPHKALPEVKFYRGKEVSS